MELTKEEKAYLEIYKGEHEERALKEWKGELPLFEKGLYLIQLSSKNINFFVNFINNPTNEILGKLAVYDLDIIFVMLMELSKLACKCALEDNYDMDLYRFEHPNNIESYNKNKLCGFKSTSYSREAVEIFNKGNNQLLMFHTKDFCPHIPINRLTDMGMFNDEYECLFPPYLNCSINGNDVDVYVDDKIDLYDYNALPQATDNFVKQLMIDKKTGVVSNELKEYCKHINGFLRYSIQSVYQRYKNIYNETKGNIR